MAHTSSKEEGIFLSTTVHLTNSDVIRICDAASPVAAFASLVLSIADAGLTGPVVQAISSAVVWQLKSKNAEFGQRGLRIKFRSLRIFPTMLAADLAVMVSTLRVKPPKD